MQSRSSLLPTHASTLPSLRPLEWPSKVSKSLALTTVLRGSGTRTDLMRHSPLTGQSGLVELMQPVAESWLQFPTTTLGPYPLKLTPEDWYTIPSSSDITTAFVPQGMVLALSCFFSVVSLTAFVPQRMVLALSCFSSVVSLQSECSNWFPIAMSLQSRGVVMTSAYCTALQMLTAIKSLNRDIAYSKHISVHCL